jgi:hypothetical protein
MKNEKREIRYSRNYLHEVNFTDDNGVTGQYIFHDEKDAEKFDRIKSIEVDNFDTPEQMLPFDFDKDIIKTVELKIPSNMAFNDAIRDYVPSMVENLSIKRTDLRNNKEYEHIFSGLHQTVTVNEGEKFIQSSHSIAGNKEDIDLAMQHREFLTALSSGSQTNMNLHPFYANFPMQTLSNKEYEYTYNPIIGRNDKTILAYTEVQDNNLYITIDEIVRKNDSIHTGDKLTLGIKDVGTDNELQNFLSGNTNVPLKDLIFHTDMVLRQKEPLYIYAKIETSTLEKGIDFLMKPENKKALSKATLEITEDNGDGICYTVDKESGSYIVQYDGEDITYVCGGECLSNTDSHSEKLSEAMFNLTHSLDETEYELTPDEKLDVISTLPDNSFLNNEKENEMDI